MRPDCFDGRSAVLHKVGQEFFGEFLSELGAGLAGCDRGPVCLCHLRTPLHGERGRDPLITVLAGLLTRPPSMPRVNAAEMRFAWKFRNFSASQTRGAGWPGQGPGHDENLCGGKS